MARATGTPIVFMIAVLVVIAWALCGPEAGYSDTWQLIINTGTTVVTFLMVFLIQNTQNRDAREIHLKLDELLRSSRRARNLMIHLSELSDEDLDRLEKQE